jgi:hypothetical protein
VSRPGVDPWIEKRDRLAVATQQNRCAISLVEVAAWASQGKVVDII